VIEPVQTTEGVLPLPPTFVDAVIELAHRAGGLAVLDEIYTGLGRCGLLFYSEQLRQKPDLVVLGKTLGNGSPIATVVGPAAVVDALPAGLQTSTFSGNPISCAAAVAVLDSVLEEDLPRRARGLQDRLRAHGEYMTSEFPFVAGWRVTGGLAAFDCIDTEGRLAPELARAFARCALAEGLLLFTGGAEESTVKIVPPLVLTDGEIDALATGLTAAARRTRSWGADQ
jgi:4-aminobutyrate aminotransferase/(S)-3-amino-2-methylpropionate transaminase